LRVLQESREPPPGLGQYLLIAEFAQHPDYARARTVAGFAPAGSQPSRSNSGWSFARIGLQRWLLRTAPRAKPGL
jgi:hypothetical protein